MTARQGRVITAVAVVVLTVMLLRSATETGNWVGFVVTEIGLLIPMTISWWLLRESPQRR